ncbi:hypothetical protein [Pseudomonas yamanorum]
MNIIWYVLRPFYALGLVVCVPLFIVVLNNLTKDSEVSTPMLIGCVLYFMLGYLVFKTAPDFFNARLLARVEQHKAQGF